MTERDREPRLSDRDVTHTLTVESPPDRKNPTGLKGFDVSEFYHLIPEVFREENPIL